MTFLIYLLLLRIAGLYTIDKIAFGFFVWAIHVIVKYPDATKDSKSKKD